MLINRLTHIKMKKNVSFLIVLILIFSIIVALIINFTKTDSTESEKIEIIATLFPQYDFAKQIGGDKVNVTLLLPPGTESHTYEPTPQDMVNINNSDLFIYTGEEMEPWANNLISGMKDNINVLDLSKTVNLINSEEFEEKHTSVTNENTNINETIGGNEKTENGHGHEENNIEREDKHQHSYDPHIWLNPLYAIKMVESIEYQLSQIDPENAEYYKQNANQYIEQIRQLDKDFEETVNSSKSKKVAFGGAFAYAYFIERYNLEFISAYETCGENSEPSTTQVKDVIDYINENNIPVIFYKEYSTGNVAKTISEATGAKMLIFYTAHNVSKEDLEAGATYVSIMRKNLDNLKQSLLE